MTRRPCRLARILSERTKELGLNVGEALDMIRDHYFIIAIKRMDYQFLKYVPYRITPSESKGKNISFRGLRISGGNYTSRMYHYKIKKKNLERAQIVEGKYNKCGNLLSFGLINQNLSFKAICFDGHQVPNDKAIAALRSESKFAMERGYIDGYWRSLNGNTVLPQEKAIIVIDRDEMEKWIRTQPTQKDTYSGLPKYGGNNRADAEEYISYVISIAVDEDALISMPEWEEIIKKYFRRKGIWVTGELHKRSIVPIIYEHDKRFKSGTFRGGRENNSARKRGTAITERLASY